MSLALPARADLVALSNGDSFAGRLRRLEDGELLFSTEFAGDLRLDWKAVKSLSTMAPCEVRLASGARLTGRLVGSQSEPGGAGDEADEFGSEEIAPTGDQAGDLLGVETADGFVTAPLAEVVAIGPPRRLAGYVEGGFAARVDPESAYGFYARAGARLVTPQTLGYADGFFTYGERSGRAERRETVLEGLAARSIAGRYCASVAADLLLDEFREIEARGVLGVGLGVRADPGADRVAFADVGPAYYYEARDRGADEAAFALQLGARFDGEIAGPIGADARLFALLSTERAQDFKVRLLAGPRLELGAGIYLAARVSWEYDGRPARSVATDETALEAGLGWRF